MTIQDYYNTIINISPWFIVKIIVLTLLLFYIFFAAILNRQVTLMNHVLEAKFSPLIKLFALIHLLIIIFVFALALIFL